MRTTLSLVATLGTLVLATPALAAPDLVITSLTLDPTHPDVGAGTISTTFKNVGADDVDLPSFPIPEYTNVAWYLDGILCADKTIGDLAVGEEATKTTSSCNPSTPGPHEIVAVVDTGDNPPGSWPSSIAGDVAESNEANNSYAQTFTWSGPDLVITDIALDPANPGIGEGKLTATIENVGPYGTGTGVVINLTMYLDGVQCDTGLIYFGLAAGSSTTEQTKKCNPQTAGEHTIRFEVDTDDDVPEVDESNNSFEKTFQWGAVDPCAVPEVCDGQDNDCDGQTDEDFADKGEACDGPDDDSCAEGTWVCNAAGDGLTCEGDDTNHVELCNGVDDDCDGQTDESFLGLGEPCTLPDTGCGAQGVTACKADGSGTECAANLSDDAEACNAQDDDCDGVTDEPFPELGQPCRVGTGACQAAGVYACDQGGGVVCDATENEPGQEICDNGIDDDCDSKTDEGCECEGTTFPCGWDVGACQAGHQNCVGGLMESMCIGAKGPSEELCDDGVDNDCDGSIDEGCPCTPGATQDCDSDTTCLAGGKQTCSDAGYWGVCDKQFPAEVCGDEVDNDCDGAVDEGCGCDQPGAPPCPTGMICEGGQCVTAGGDDTGPAPDTASQGDQPTADAGPTQPDAGGVDGAVGPNPVDAAGAEFSVPGADVGGGGSNQVDSSGCNGARPSVPAAPFVLLALGLLALVWRRLG